MDHLSWLFGFVKECNRNVTFFSMDFQWSNNALITYLCSSLEYDNAQRASDFCPESGLLMLTLQSTVIYTKWGSFWKWYLACGLYITLMMSLRNVRATHSCFLKSWIWKSTWRYGILKLHVLIMQPSMLHNIRKITAEKRDVRNMKQTNILFHVTRGAGV